MDEIRRYRQILANYRRSGTITIDETTERVYANYVKDFINYLGVDQLHELIRRSSVESRKLLPRAIDDWLMSHQDWSYGTKVIAGYAVLHFLNWAYDFDYTNKAVKHLAGRGRPRVFEPYIFTDEQLDKIFSTAEELFPTYPNLTVGIFTGWDCITRASELVDIRLADISRDGWIIVRGKKGSLTNSIKVSERTWEFINAVERKHYLLEHAGRKYTAHGWEEKFRRFCEKLFGVFRGSKTAKKKKSWRWHDFARHTRITKLFEQGYSMDDIQALARHKRRESTEVYRHLVEARKRFA